MDHKTLKSDLTYVLKKLTKEGKTITFEAWPDNLQKAVTITESNETTRRVEAGDLSLEGASVDVLEALIFVKGYQYAPIKEVSDWTSPQGIHYHYEWFHHEGFGIPLTDIISEQGQIAKTDLYDFMDGLEFVEGNDKSKFYEVGAYIREKFAPVGSRAEKLVKPVFKEERHFKVERRFIVHNRAIPGQKKTGALAVVEVECEIIHNPSFKDGEFAARILKPEWLWEEVPKLGADGKLHDVLEPPAYWGHSVYWNAIQATVHAERQIRSGFEFEIRKGKRESYTDEEFKAKCAEIQTIMLT